MVGRSLRLGAGAVFLLSVLVGAGGSQPRPRTPATIDLHVAYRVTDLATGRALSSSREDLLGTPVLPGSIAKIAALIAGLESGAIGPSTRIACPRHLTLEGHNLDCSHPDIGRPLTPAEALAHSCNGYFAALARRLSRASLDAALIQLGLPPSAPTASVAASVLGIEGTRAPAERWLAALVRVGSHRARVRAETERVLIEGLRGAAEWGTASAFGEAGLTALAKTGTAPMPGGGYEGLVVALTPAKRPTRSVVVVAPSAAGRDAAALAVKLLQAHASDSRIRVGVVLPGGGYRVEMVALEEYVSRVVSAEAAPGSGRSATEAIAIVARTFASRNRGRHAREGFDLCDLTHCQVMGTSTRASDEAAGATAGQMLFYRGQLADVYYTASCGGYSERPSLVWAGGADPPYLVSRAEPQCSGERWQSEISAREIARALTAAGHEGGLLRDLRVLGRTPSGRVESLGLTGMFPEQTSGEDFRLAIGRTLGWQRLKSSLFELQRTSSGYRFTGTGRGHGVGLCVAGATRMAAAGQPVKSLLSRYFPGTVVGGAPLAGSRGPESRDRLTIVLPQVEERERARVEAIAEASLREFSSRLDVDVPGGIRIVVHPSVEAYTRATGQPWWTAGATRGLHIDLVPLTGLRTRGLLESTLRHELAHAITSERLAGRPVWVREAVAMELAGDSRLSGVAERRDRRETAGAPCPTDDEWRGARSARDLDVVYDRAAACYASQRARGVRWDRVR